MCSGDNGGEDTEPKEGAKAQPSHCINLSFILRRVLSLQQLGDTVHYYVLRFQLF